MKREKSLRCSSLTTYGHRQTNMSKKQKSLVSKADTASWLEGTKATVMLDEEWDEQSKYIKAKLSRAPISDILLRHQIIRHPNISRHLSVEKNLLILLWSLKLSHILKPWALDDYQTNQRMGSRIKIILEETVTRQITPIYMYVCVYYIYINFTKCMHAFSLFCQGTIIQSLFSPLPRIISMNLHLLSNCFTNNTKLCIHIFTKQLPAPEE